MVQHGQPPRRWRGPPPSAAVTTIVKLKLLQDRLTGNHLENVVHLRSVPNGIMDLYLGLRIHILAHMILHGQLKQMQLLQAGIGGLNTDPECKYCASEINGNRAGKTETLSPGAYQIAFIVYPCKDKSWEQSECPVGIWMIVVIEDPDPDDCCPIGIEDVTTYYTSDDTSDPNGYGEDDRVYHTFMTNAAVAANAIHIGVPFNPNCEYIALFLNTKVKT